MTTGAGATAPTTPGRATAYQVVRRLQRAAAHSEARLIAEAATLAGGWAVLVDRGGRAVQAHPVEAASRGVRAAAHPLAHRHLAVRKTVDATLVIAPGPAASPTRTGLIQSATIDLLRVRGVARHAEELHRQEQRQHRAVLALLLAGQARLAVGVLGCDALSHATVYRLSGEAAEAAYGDLWHRVRPPGPAASPRTLVGLQGMDLTVVALHGAEGDLHRRRDLLARLAQRYRLTGGASEPVLLDMAATAWLEASTARSGARAGHLAPTAGLGDQGLLHVIPSGRLASWSAAVLRPLSGEQRKALEACLRSGSAAAAASALTVSEGTVRQRLRTAGSALGVDLDDPSAQALLLLAVRAPTAQTGPVPARRLRVRPGVPGELLSAERAHRWASALLKPLDRPLRIALRCWLLHRARTAPAAAELNLSRSTLTQWLARCGRALQLDLASAAVRAELHLAVETVAGDDDVPEALPRRGGRTYGARRPG
ncbi:helix-turn-helix domain-containing protein [Streptomyces crystallinus]|uniref:PucR C-terminal helix-turn-helix domain-containing protein n=1 Tax=Streptomyces crystallinus TaxID=68191 RepID=A0ABP3RUG3_9ACTN